MCSTRRVAGGGLFVSYDKVSEAQATVNLKRFKSLKKLATKTTLSGQPDQENNFDVQPIAPVKEQVKVQKEMKIEVAPYSFVMYTLSL